jgi:hypothetical protein
MLELLQIENYLLKKQYQIQKEINEFDKKHLLDNEDHIEGQRMTIEDILYFVENLKKEKK